MKIAKKIKYSKKFVHEVTSTQSYKLQVTSFWRHSGISSEDSSQWSQSGVSKPFVGWIFVFMWRSSHKHGPLYRTSCFFCSQHDHWKVLFGSCCFVSSKTPYSGGVPFSFFFFCDRLERLPAKLQGHNHFSSWPNCDGSTQSLLPAGLGDPSDRSLEDPFRGPLRTHHFRGGHEKP